MKILKYIGLVVIVAFSLIGICTVLILSINYYNFNQSTDIKGIATPQNPIISPSGKYQLEVVTGFNGIVHYCRFYISKIKEGNLEPEVIYSSFDTFRKCDNLYFLWDNRDNVWVYSGDIGTFYWTKDNDSFWKKHTYVDEPISVPEILKSLVKNQKR